MPAKPRPVLLAVVSDIHAGGTTSLCPDVVRFDDGAEYHASKAQRWLMQCWRDYWQRVAGQRAMADTLLQTQVETAMQADSAQIATLWAAGRASDSLVNVQRESLHRLNRYLTHARHGVAYDVTAGCLTGAAAGGAVRGVQGAIGGTLIGCGSGYLLHALRH